MDDNKHLKGMKGVPYPFGLIGSIIPSVVDHKVKLHRGVKNRVNYKDGLTYIFLYEGYELVETHLLSDYVDEYSTLSEIEKAFEKEIKLYDYIEIECLSPFLRQVYEYNKTNGEWYMTKHEEKWSFREESSKKKESNTMSELAVITDITINIKFKEVLAQSECKDRITEKRLADFHKQMFEGVVDRLDLDTENPEDVKYEVKLGSQVIDNGKITLTKCSEFKRL